MEHEAIEQLLDDEELTQYYIPQEVIGTGANGIVCLAYDERGQEVAIKKIPNVFTQRSFVTQKRCLRELKLMHQMEHPNIMRLKDVVIPSDPYFYDAIHIVMEVMEKSLEDEIQRTRIGMERQKRYAMQLMQGVEYMHSAGIVHRDLKPANLLITQETMKIADFGLAIAMCKKEAQSAYYVTRWYRAPELLLEEKELNQAIDMWSVGCILAEMMMNRPLFPGADTKDQLKQIMMKLGKPKKEQLGQIVNEKRMNFIELIYQEATKEEQKEMDTVKHPTATLYAMFQENLKLTNQTQTQEQTQIAELIDLITKCLIWDPKRRITAEEAIQHAYFAKEEPIRKQAEFKFDTTYETTLDPSNIALAIYKQIIASRPEEDEDEDEFDQEYDDEEQGGSYDPLEFSSPSSFIKQHLLF